MSDLRAGAGVGTIHFPDEMFPMEGFCGIHDDPHVRVLTAQDGDEALAIAAFELVMLQDPLVEEIQRIVADICGIAADRVFVHMTHAITTPHNPMMMPPFMRPDDAEEKGKLHMDAVYRAVREAAKQAVSNMQPVMMGSAEGISKANTNRDEKTPSGWWIGRGGKEPANHGMTVIRLAGEDGSPVAHIISYALKTCAVDNSQMEENKRLISSDVAGRACSVMEERYGIPCLFLMSAAANHVPRETALYDEVQLDGSVKTVDLGVEHGFELVDSLGNEMGTDAIAIAESITECSHESGVSVKCAAFEWQTHGRIDEKKPTLYMEYPTEDKMQSVDVFTFRIGGYAFVGAKAEMNQPTQQEIISKSPVEHTIFVTMINGGFKYMPEAAAYDNYTWEAQSAPVAKGAAEKLAEVAISLLG